MFKKVLLIQTAFPGDVILATALLESLHQSNPGFKIDLLIRNGNEALFNKHPFLNKLHVWNKSAAKYANLYKLVRSIRKEKYDLVLNLQRFSSSGILTMLSGANETRGFDKNPFSFFFTKKIKHTIGDGRHEIDRNLDLISDFSIGKSSLPRLYPTLEDENQIKHLKKESYICIAPGSVWFTKKFPAKKWIEFIKLFIEKNNSDNIYLLGSKSENNLCNEISNEVNNLRLKNLAGELSFLQSAALMRDAKMNFVNDSAPLHIASAMNAKTTAVFCSTVPAFGFGPLTPGSKIVETSENLSCRPCGIHGFKTCPQGHFKCALTIDVNYLIP